MLDLNIEEISSPIKSGKINLMLGVLQKIEGMACRDFKQNSMILDKNKLDFVDRFEKRVEKKIAEFFLNKVKGDGIIGKHYNIDSTNENNWVINPLDGRANFLRNIPIFCISVAFMTGNIVKSCVVINPLLGEIYQAEVESGAYLNDAKISVSKEVKENKLFGSCTNEEVCIDTANTRSLGCSTLSMCYVASGRFDFSVDLGKELVDVAAGALMVTEAKGFVSKSGVTCNNILGFGKQSLVSSSKMSKKYIQNNLKI
ncbi:inositol monophosphatase family protein [Candidatus Nesciobacter abundans]|nr:inositol monophosphatase [Candidatus Nesciobacter abundans]